MNHIFQAKLRRVYSEASPTAFNGAYIQESVHGTAAFILVSNLQLDWLIGPSRMTASPGKNSVPQKIFSTPHWPIKHSSTNLTWCLYNHLHFNKVLAIWITIFSSGTFYSCYVDKLDQYELISLLKEGNLCSSERIPPQIFESHSLWVWVCAGVGVGVSFTYTIITYLKTM